MHLPRPQRRWGMVTWMADVFLLSRPALYALAERVRQRVFPEAERPALPTPEQPVIAVTPERLAWTILTTRLPGKTAIRPLRHVLEEAFDQTRSIGWISELITSAGRRAGQVLGDIDTSPLGTVIAARDETFFQGHPLLLILDPVSTSILFAQVTTDRQADTWGIALLMAQEQGVTIGGLVEDMARMYAKSQKEAELEVLVQKDVWHIQRDGARIQRDLERAALRATRQVIELDAVERILVDLGRTAQRQRAAAHRMGVLFLPPAEGGEHVGDLLFAQVLVNLGGDRGPPFADIVMREQCAPEGKARQHSAARQRRAAAQQAAA